MSITNKIFKTVFYIIDTIKGLKIGEKFYLEEQKKYFDQLGLDRNKALEKLQSINLEVNEKNYGMFSEHITLFSALSLKKNILNILEIGTFDGANAYIMSKIFDNANIETIDLNEKNTIFNQLYNRDQNIVLENLFKNREKYLSKSERLKFKKFNSIDYIYSDIKDKFDMIWVDGHHGNPYVTIDIINSLKMIKKDGLIICDDVLTSKYLNPYDPYNSNATFFTLNELKKNNFINYDLIYKRLSKNINKNRLSRKYIAIVKKI